MPSVKSRFDLNPPLPRMLINDSELAVAAKTLFLSRTSESFKEYLNTKTVEPLKLLMGQMVSIDGRERFTRTQSKLQRIASIIDWCTGFLFFLLIDRWCWNGACLWILFSKVSIALLPNLTRCCAP